MTEVVILVISTSLLIIWLFSLKFKATQMRSQTVLAGDPKPHSKQTVSDARQR